MGGKIICLGLLERNRENAQRKYKIWENHHTEVPVLVKAELHRIIPHGKTGHSVPVYSQYVHAVTVVRWVPVYSCSKIVVTIKVSGLQFTESLNIID